MVYFPLIYFTCLFGYILFKERSWNMDLAATSILMIISFCAILIDEHELYGEYGVNNDYLTVPTVLLFCAQWTIVLWSIHILCRLPLRQNAPIKMPMLYTLFVLLIVSSFAMIAVSLEDIRDAMIMDIADVSDAHYYKLEEGISGDKNYLLFIPNILVSAPFPTLALFLWFYMKAFMDCSIFLRAGILIASVVQTILAIAMAGRAAFIFWAFDFFLVYSYFYQYLKKNTRWWINITAAVIGGLAGALFIAITMVRFDTGSNSNALDSLFAYAGQHINNFCAVVTEGGDTPFLPGRIFPLLTKLFTGQNFDLYEHYNELTHSVDALVNVFDTFGGELYLDIGLFGYIFFFIALFLVFLIIKNRWKELAFHHIFLFVILVAFFTRGLFAWPFTGHYTTLALLLSVSFCYFFKYIFKI